MLAASAAHGGQRHRQHRAQQRGRRPQLGGVRPHLRRNPLQPAGRDQSRDRAAPEPRLDAGSRRHQQSRRRWPSTASSTWPRATASCTRSTRRPASCCGATTPRSPRSPATSCAPAGAFAACAFWKGRLFVGTHDGRLIAHRCQDRQARSGACRPSTPHDGSFVSGPPRVFNDKVIIGFGGGDFGAVRGYVTAYDTDTGKQLWRWWTVPGDPAKGFENKAMEMAAKTWTGEWWKYGGGGTVWNAMTYDPEFNRALPRHRQRRAVEPEDPQPRRRRQPVPVLDRRAECRHRRIRLALPDHSRRRVGLQLRHGHDAGHAEHRRRAAQGAAARAEERLLLRARSRRTAS